MQESTQYYTTHALSAQNFDHTVLVFVLTKYESVESHDVVTRLCRFVQNHPFRRFSELRTAVRVRSCPPPDSVCDHFQLSSMLLAFELPCDYNTVSSG